jgi:hypothetical protein
MLVHNGAVNVTQEKYYKWLNYPNKMYLPMFISMNILNQFINALQINFPDRFKKNLEINLLNYFESYMFDEDQPDFLIFNSFGLSPLHVD